MIRIATLKDVDRIEEFIMKLAQETENLNLDRDTVRKGVINVINDKQKGSYYVYEKENEIIGQLLVTYEWSDWHNSNYWWIQSVYVDKEYRNQKVFSKLLDYVTSLAKDMNACGVRLYVDEKNKNAQEIYSAYNINKSHYSMFEAYYN